MTISAIRRVMPSRMDSRRKKLRLQNVYSHITSCELCTVDGVPFLDGRMFIPQSLRRDVLSGLHAAHLIR